MSDVEMPDERAAWQKSDEMPAAILLAIVCGVGVALLWAFASLMLIGLAQSYGSSGFPWLLACLFATGAGVVGIIGCARRWAWVRWAALLQVIVIAAALCTFVGWMPFVLWVIGLFAAYAGLQFLPSAHRWYHPAPGPGSHPAPTGTTSEIGSRHAG